MTNGEQNNYAYVNRTIYLSGSINYDKSEEIISSIKQINEYDSMVEQEQLSLLEDYISRGIIKEDSIQGLAPREPITLEINSGGGHTSAGFAIVSAIENSETPIIGYVTGDCMSMATSVIVACDYRMCTEYSSFMIHDVYAGVEGKFNDLNSSVNYIKKIKQDYHRLIVKYTDMDAETLDLMIDANADFHFTPKDARDYGLIDSLDNEDINEESFLNKLYGLTSDIEVEEEVAEESITSEDSEPSQEVDYQNILRDYVGEQESKTTLLDKAKNKLKSLM